MYLNRKIAVVLPVAGSGTRMGHPEKKQYLKIDGKSIMEWTLTFFLTLNVIDGIWVVSPHDDLEYVKKEVLKIKEKCNYLGQIYVVSGGKQRQHSVYNALKQISQDYDDVIVHDGVRPFVPKDLIFKQLEMMKQHQACILAIPSTDTLKRVRKDTILETIDRSEIWMAQTPQIFNRSKLLEVHRRAEIEAFVGTDDASLFERYGHPVMILEGDRFNIKITTPYDLILGETIVKWLQEN